MKKTIAILSAALLSLSALAGCGSSASSSGGGAAEPAASEAGKEAAQAAAGTEAAAKGTEAAADAAASGEEAASAEETASAPASDKDSDWAYIQDKGELVVGITMFAPMNYEDESGELVGFDTELTKAVCEKLGVTPNFTEINWDSKEIELNSKNIDCIWNGMCITEERKENMSISTPYLYNTQAIVVKKDREAEIMKDVSGLNVVAEQGSTGEGKLDGSIPDDDTVKVSPSEFFANVNYTPVDSMAKALMEVKSGTADLALVDSVCALAMVGEGTDYDDMVVNLDNNFGQQEYGIAFRKGSDVTEKVNKAINELYDEGKVQEIAEKYGLTDILIR